MAVLTGMNMYLEYILSLKFYIRSNQLSNCKKGWTIIFNSKSTPSEDSTILTALRCGWIQLR